MRQSSARSLICMSRHSENGMWFECVWLGCDLRIRQDGSGILTREIRTVPVSNLVFTRPGDPSSLINSQWVLKQRWTGWQCICCGFTRAFFLWKQMENTCSSVWHNGWLHPKHLIPTPLLLFYFTEITQRAHSISSYYTASMETVSECQSEENEGL